MIVLTGPGRGGTSLLARLYQELGFDPGGTWNDEINAGLEDPEVAALNVDCQQILGVPSLGPGGQVGLEARSEHRLSTLVPHPLRRGTLLRLERRMNARRLRHISPVRWKEVPNAARVLGPRMRDVAAKKSVVKDPRFCMTLPVWIAAGASVDHVVATLRPTAAGTQSRLATGLTVYADEDTTRTDVVLRLGALVDCILEARVPATVIRFPQWISDANQLTHLPLPAPRDGAEIAAAMKRIANPDLVHHV